MTVETTTKEASERRAVVLVYITTPTTEVAERIARVLVEERLAACANILAPMTSIYRWEGAVQQDSEVVLICKTGRFRVPELEAKVKSLHPYQCPCVVALPVVAGSAQFLDWVNEQVLVQT